MTGASLYQMAIGFANRAVPFGATILLHTTVLLGAGLLLARFSRRYGAAVQSLILKAFLLAMVACPFVESVYKSVGFSMVHVTVPVEHASVRQLVWTGAPAGGIAGLFTDTALQDSYAGSVARPGGLSPAGAGTGSSEFLSLIFSPPQIHHDSETEVALSGRSVFYVIFLAIWVTASIILAFRFLYSFFRVVYLRYRACNAEIALYQMSESIVCHYDIETPDMLRSELISSPFLTGVIRPAIMLPARIRITTQIIVHELGHMLRGDCAWQFLGQLALIVVPVQPLLYLMNRSIETISDYVCDDFVIAHTDNPHEYALQLVNFAEILNTSASIPAGMGFFSGKSKFRERIERIITTREIEFEPRKRAIVAVSFICLAATLSAAVLVFKEEAARELLVLVPRFAATHIVMLPGAGLLEAVAEKAPDASAATATMDKSERKYSDLTDREQAAELITEAMTGTMAEWDVWQDFEYGFSWNDYGIESEQGPDVPDEKAVIDENGIEVAMRSFAPPVESENKPNPVMESSEGVPAYVVVNSVPEPEIDLDAYTTRDKCIKDGIRYFNETRYFTAIKLFKRALRFKSKDPEANYWVGYCYLMTDDLDNAEWFFKIAIAQKPNYDLAYLRLGDTHRLRGDLHKAWENGYKIALDLNPEMSREKVLF
jgi:beta-lactamase regulating signal transducer with metallopeptidase domain/tetratricopeptide (TPR) repeat protein